MSGSAGISILEEGLYYSYQEHGRKILSADDYEDYFARKRKAMLGALAYATPEFQSWRKSVATAGLEIEDAPIFRTDQDDPLLSTIQIDGERGETRLTIEWRRPPTETQKRKLQELSSRLEFTKLERKWAAVNYPEVPKERYLNGVFVIRSFPKFTLSLAMTADIPSRLEPAVRRALQHKMDILIPGIESGFDGHVANDTFWINAETLISYEKGVGALPKGAELNEPQKSKFNFFGPLFDGIGGRTMRSIGHVKASMLFLSSNKDWDKDSRYLANRGAFENWFGWAIREPQEVSIQMSQLTEAFLESWSKSEEDRRLPTEKLESVLKQTALYEVATKPALQKLRTIAMDAKAEPGLVKHVLNLLVWVPSLERDLTIRDWLVGRRYSGGHEGTTPIVFQAGQRMVVEALTAEVPKSESVRMATLREGMKRDALQTLGLLIAAYRLSDLPEVDRGWAKSALQTVRNSTESALKGVNAGRAFDKAFIGQVLKHFDGLEL